MFKKIALLVLSSIAFQPHAQAGYISYEVNRSLGAFGTVTGTIETDGTLGLLNSGNIVDWNISLNADSNQTTIGQLLGPLSGNNSSLRGFPRTAITATTNGFISTLFIDFGTISSEIFQIASNDYKVVWQMQPGIPFQDELVRESFEDSNPNQAYAFYGPVTHALGTASVVPLPAATWLFLTGLSALSAFTRKQANQGEVFESSMYG